LICGSYQDANHQAHNFIRSADGQTFTAFDSADGQTFTQFASVSAPVAINDQGEVLMVVSSPVVHYGVLRSADGLTYTRIDLGPRTTIGGINNNSEIVGWSKDLPSYSASHGFLRTTDGKYQIVDLPGTLEGTWLVGINNHSQILVYSGFVLNPDGSSLAVPGQWPAAINDNGVVVGMEYPAGSRGFIAVPTAATTQPVIRSALGVQSASAFGGMGYIAPGSWVEIYGVNLAPRTREWAAGDFVDGNIAPTSLDSVTVTINGQPAFVSYISPGQVNAQAPSNLTPGMAVVRVTNGTETSAPSTTTIQAVEPGLLQTVADEVHNNITAFLPDGSLAQTVRPGDTLILYGIGFGPTTPDVSAGQIASQSDKLQGLFEAGFSTGGLPVTAEVTYAGHAPGSIGLYQFNIVVPNQGSQPYRAELKCLLNGRVIGAPLLSASLNVVP
jgi:uncharacterized protein (TIGR03437 family)